MTTPAATRLRTGPPSASPADPGRTRTDSPETATATPPLSQDRPSEAEALVARGPGLARPMVAGSVQVTPPAVPSAGSAARPNPQLPDPRSVSCSIAQAAVEVLAGIRPVAQLTRWVVPEVYNTLATRAAITVRQRGRRTTPRVTVRRVRVCRLSQLVTEASVVLDDGDRVRAAAIRLEGHRGYWRATVLEIG